MTDTNASLTNRFLSIGKLEGYSYLALLFIAMPLKYMADMPLAVRIAGSINAQAQQFSDQPVYPNPQRSPYWSSLKRHTRING